MDQRFLRKISEEVQELQDVANLLADVKMLQSTTNRDYDTKNRVMGYLHSQELKYKAVCIRRMNQLQLLSTDLVISELTHFIRGNTPSQEAE